MTEVDECYTDGCQSLIGTFSTLRRCVVFGRMLQSFLSLFRYFMIFLSLIFLMHFLSVEIHFCCLIFSQT